MRFRIIIFAALLVVSVAASAITFSGSTSLTPAGAAAQSLVSATGAGALAGRFAAAATGIGVAVSAIEICMLTKCYQYIPGIDAEPPVPDGWINGNTPPSTSSPSIEYRAGSSFPWNSTGQGACDDWVASDPLNAPWGTFADNPARCINSSNGVVGTGLSTRSVCPSGYVVSGSNCVLSDASAVKWPSDGKPTLMPDGSGGWKDHPRDPDSFNGTFAGGGASGEWDNPPSMPSSSPIEAEGQDQYGNPQNKTIAATPQGGTKLTETTQGQNPTTGQTETTKHELTTNAAGQIINYTFQIFTNQTLSQTTTTGSGSGQPTTFPDDYARENTQQINKGLLQDIKEKLSLDAPAAPPEGPEVDDETINLPQISESGGSLGSGSCPAGISFTALGSTHTVSLDPICQVAVIAGYLVLAFAYYIAARIVGGGIQPS